MCVGGGGGDSGVFFLGGGLLIYQYTRKKIPDKIPNISPNIPKIERDVVCFLSKISCKQSK